MRAATSRQYQRIELINGQEPDFGSAQVVRDEMEARRLLMRFLEEPTETPILRALLASLGELLPLHLLSQSQLIDQLLRHILVGRIRLARKWNDAQWKKEAPRSASRPQAAPAEYAPGPRAPAPREAPAPEPEEESSPIVQDRQAEVLEQAAAEGLPFCEECERLKKQLEASHAANQDAQADALVAAADEGLPFCEECERLKQQMAQGAAS